MISNSKKGQYYKRRSKEWGEKKGYQVAYLEMIYNLWINGRIIPRKKDQLGSDLLFVSKDEIIFIQVKFGKLHVAEGVNEFKKFIFPDCAKKQVHIWEKGARDPIIKNC